MLPQLALPAVLWILLAPASAPVGPRQESGTALRYTFSEGPFERAWALVDAAVAPTRLEPDRIPALDPVQRESSDTWRRWAAAVRAASGSEEASAQRLWLAAFACAQERYDDAWEHLAHAAGDAPGLSAVLPLMAPGVVPRALASWPQLPDGALLLPALPPPDRPASQVLLGTGRVRGGAARVEGFRVGAAQLALSIHVEGDGVELVLEHLGGGPARVRVRLPEPPDFELHSEYLDWSRLEGTRCEREVELTPGGEARTLFGRYQPRRLEWPAQVPRALCAQLQRDGVLLLASPGGALEGLRAGLQDLLGLRVEVRELPPGLRPAPLGGVQVDLRSAAAFSTKRASLVSVAERFALSAPR